MEGLHYIMQLEVEAVKFSDFYYKIKPFLGVEEKKVILINL